jgi:hypothetical protein
MRSRNCLPLTRNRVHLTFGEHLCSPYPWRAPGFTLPLASTRVHTRISEGSVLLIFLVFCIVLCLFAYFLFVMGLCLVCPMLPVSLDLSWACVLCVQCCQCLWICHGPVSCVFNVASVTGFVMGLCLVCPMLPVSLDYLFLRISVKLIWYNYLVQCLYVFSCHPDSAKRF